MFIFHASQQKFGLIPVDRTQEEKSSKIRLLSLLFINLFAISNSRTFWTRKTVRIFDTTPMKKGFAICTTRNLLELKTEDRLEISRFKFHLLAGAQFTIKTISTTNLAFFRHMSDVLFDHIRENL